MRGPSLTLAATLSVLLHMATFSAIVLLAGNSMKITPPPYIVSIVSPDETPVEMPTYGPSVEETWPATSEGEGEMAVAPETKHYLKDRLKEMKERRQSERHVSDRIRDIEARKRLDGIRRSALTRADKAEPGERTVASNELEMYYSKVREKILRAWVYPDIGETNREAVISITVLGDGTLRTNRFERPSGNAVFDRTALRAINKATPVSPPPMGMELEIGVRFAQDEKH